METGPTGKAIGREQPIQAVENKVKSGRLPAGGAGKNRSCKTRRNYNDMWGQIIVDIQDIVCFGRYRFRASC